MIQKLKTLNLCLLQIIGCIFVLSSIFKWIGLRTFAITVDDFCAFLGYVPLYGYGMLLAVVICTAETVLGISAFIPYLRKYVAWAYLLTIGYFTYVTYLNFYSLYGQIESCGCFGEVIHLTPAESFYKNVVLLSMIVTTCLFSLLERIVHSTDR